MIYEDVVRLFGEKDIQPFYMEYSEVVKKILEDAMSMSEAKKESKVSLNTLSIAMLLQKESVAVVLLNNYHVPFDEIKNHLGGHFRSRKANPLFHDPVIGRKNNILGVP